jgi:hypothetical protein
MIIFIEQTTALASRKRLRGGNMRTDDGFVKLWMDEWCESKAAFANAGLAALTAWIPSSIER